MNITPVNFLNSGRPYPLNAEGNKVQVRTSDNRHYFDVKQPEAPDNMGETFSSVFFKAMEKVNDQQVIAEEMTQKMAIDPDSVEVHDLMIASEKARLSLTFTKTIADGAVRAYRELTTLR